MTDWKFIFEKWVLGKHRRRAYEPEVKRELAKVRGELFVDIGANIGTYAIPLSKHFSKVYAFEPNPKALTELHLRIARQHLDNITVHPIALAEREGETRLYLDPHQGLSGSADTILPLFKYNPANDSSARSHVYTGKEGVMVKTARYDSLIKETADLVKIDVEGAEFLVLKGMEESLKHRRVKAIMVELHDADRRTELEEMLRQYSFSLTELDPHPRIIGYLQ